MTRINVGVPVQLLSDKHLIAEHREIKRIPNCIKKGKFNLEGIPDKVVLGTGHVKFFYNKLKYLHKRYIEIRDECVNRSFNVSDFEDCFKDLPKDLYNDYNYSFGDCITIASRLIEKEPNNEKYKAFARIACILHNNSIGVYDELLKSKYSIHSSNRDNSV